MSFEHLENILDHYDNLLEYERSLWKRSSDRLPDDGIFVIVNVPECESDQVWVAYHDDDRWFWAGNYSDARREVKGTVTHWRHLPDPPRA